MSIIIFLMGFLVGWLYAHSTIAEECEKLGKFYVGSRIYTCTKINDIGEEQ